jgi:inorganic pyrophosphatase
MLPDALSPSARGGLVHVVVETPRGSSNKYAFDAELGLFRLTKVLPAGMSFPFDFGFVPSTLGGDGDPLDLLLLLDEPAFPGCLVDARLVGVIEVEQTSKKKTVRNDRLIAVAKASRTHSDVRSLDDLNPRLLDEIEHFFASYLALEGQTVERKGRGGPDRARTIVEEGITRAKESR